MAKEFNLGGERFELIFTGDYYKYSAPWSESLYSAYKRPSHTKMRIYEEWKSWERGINNDKNAIFKIADFDVTGYCCNFFTMGGDIVLKITGEIIGAVKITAYHNYMYINKFYKYLFNEVIDVAGVFTLDDVAAVVKERSNINNLAADVKEGVYGLQELEDIVRDLSDKQGFYSGLWESLRGLNDVERNLLDNQIRELGFTDTVDVVMWLEA